MAGYVLVALILSYSLVSITASEDSIKQGESIQSHQIVTSAGGNFALGFFSPGNSTNRYIGVWYKTIPKQTVIWVANRETPIPENSSAVLRIGSDGNLVLLQERRDMIWSSNATISPSSVNSSVAVLLDSGNLVLRIGDKYVWQSIDHPTDTLMPGMRFSINTRTGKRTIGYSWASDEDPSPGKFSMGIDPQGRPQLFIWKENVPYWRTSVYDYSFTYGGYNNSQGFASYTSFAAQGDETYFIFSVSEIVAKLRAVILPTGQAKLLIWGESTASWLSLRQAPVSKCDFYSQCGQFGSCEQNGSLPLCSCLIGFEPKDEKEWNLGNWTGGCTRKVALRCDTGDRFLKYEKMKLPDYSDSLGHTTISQCESKCRENCSCTAYAYSNVSGGGSTVNCRIWRGDLVDLVHNFFTGEDLYVRVHDNGRGTSIFSDKRRVVGVATAVISIGFFLLIVGGFFMNKKMLRSQGRIGEGVPKPDAKYGGELLSFSFRSILAASDSFSEGRKLGEGGFGPVYKGNLSGTQEVAIKRLCKRSSQGMEEFLNELKLIAKLQHTNLVRLLGCCVEEDEKILIYEYMSNGSLDKILFYPSGENYLDWRKRFRIIEGIAQGLTYIHKYSRLKVIHRDLKASNVLLDEAMNPKISDFGMARIFGEDQVEGKTKRVVGTYGYMSPEYAMYGKFSEKSDVFSFGVLLLEIVTGKKSSSFNRNEFAPTLFRWVWESWIEGRGLELTDPSIRETCKPNEALKCINVGLLCVQENPNDRPTMTSVVLMLGNDIDSIPSPKEPAYASYRSSNTTNPSSPDTSGSCSKNTVTVSEVQPR